MCKGDLAGGDLERVGLAGYTWHVRCIPGSIKFKRLDNGGENMRDSCISSLELGKGDREKITLALCDKTAMGVTMSRHWTRRTKDSV